MKKIYKIITLTIVFIFLTTYSPNVLNVFPQKRIFSLRYKHRNYNKLNFQNSAIFYDEGIKINQTSNENVLDIYQQSSGSRLYIIGGELENLKIKFNSYKSTTNEIFPKIILLT